MSDTTAIATKPRPADATRLRLLEAAGDALRELGFAALSTRDVARRAGVPLSQIHYHFGSKRGLVLSLLTHLDERLLRRQRDMYDSDLPLWRQWEIACDYFDEDLESGYVAILMAMTAAGWSDAAIAEDISHKLQGWLRLLTDVAARAETRFGGFGPLSPTDVAILVGQAFVGAEALLLLRNEAVQRLPLRAALRRFGALIRTLEDGATAPGD